MDDEDEDEDLPGLPDINDSIDELDELDAAEHEGIIVDTAAVHEMVFKLRRLALQLTTIALLA